MSNTTPEMSNEALKEFIQMRAERDDTQDLAEQQKEALADEFTNTIQAQAIHDEVGYYRKEYKLPKQVVRERKKRKLKEKLSILFGLKKPDPIY